MGQPTKNQGEGNRDADREYRQGVTQHVQSGQSEPKAREAEQALDDEDEREEMDDAEQIGRSR